ncbi:MAG: hypothetical protein NTU88_14325, partial [Armatimonadetes bacterium]|nr:hypothetical protein [Armatimonadota bacterium]
MSGQSLSSGESSVVFESVGGVLAPRVCINGDAGPKVVLEGLDFLTFTALGATVPARITSVSCKEVLEFGAELPGMQGLRVLGRIVPAGDLAPRFDWHFRIANLGEDIVECSAHIRFNVVDTGVPRWMIPAMFYKDNRPANCVRMYPRYSFDENKPGEFVSSYWAFRSDRSSCPAVFCWTDNFTSCVATPASFGGEISGVGFKGDADG